MRYAKYKPTGIAWLSEVPEEWVLQPLKRVVDVPITDGPHETPEFVDEGVPFVSAEAAHDGRIFLEECRGLISKSLHEEYCKKVKPRRNDIFVVKSGSTTGKTVMVDIDDEFSVWSPLALIRVANKASHKFVFYFLSSCFFQKEVQDNWSFGTQPNIGMGVLGRLIIPLPPHSAQHSIVAFLDEKCGKVDRLVAAKEKEVALLKELKQSMIAEAVTRGVPAAANAENAKGAKMRKESLCSSADSAFFASAPAGDPSRRLVPSGIPWLPEVPEGWNVQRLASLFCDDVKPNKDFAYTKAMKFNYGTLASKNEIGEHEDYRDVYVKYSVLQKNDIVINGLNLNYDFNSLRVACSPCDGIITSAYIVCRPRDGVESAYFTYLFKAMDYRKMFHGMGTGIRLTLSFNELRGQMLPVPPLAEQREIVAHIEARAAKIDAAVSGLEKEIAALKEYKQRLIADVVTGQRRVA